MDAISDFIRTYIRNKINKGWRPELKERLVQSKKNLEDIEERLTDRAKEFQNHFERADLLEHILDHSSILVAAFDLEHNFAYTNERYASIYKSNSDDLIGKKVVDVIGTEIWDVVRENHLKASVGEVVLAKYSIDFNGVKMNFDTQYYPYYNGGVIQKGYVLISSMSLAE